MMATLLRARSFLSDQFWRELRVSLRRLVATPLFTIVAIVSLAVGIGTTTALYASMYNILWPAGGIHEVNRVFYVLAGTYSGRSTWNYALARGDFEDLRTSVRGMVDLAAWTPVTRTYLDGSVAEVFNGEAVTGNAFSIAGVAMTAGRPVQASDDLPSADPVLVVSYSFWQRRLGGAPDVVGRSVRFGGRPFRVVGIADRTFQGFGPPRLGTGANGWIPLATLASLGTPPPSATRLDNRDMATMSAFGRLPTGTPIAAVAAAISATGQRLDAMYPLRVPSGANVAGSVYPRRWSALTVPDAIAAQFPTAPAFTLLALVSLVIVVACTNLANLTLARGSARLHEFAVRRALGASRWRLVREQAIESVAIAICGGAFAMMVARVILIAVAAQIPPGIDMAISTDLPPGVLGALAFTVFLTLLVFGLWPALQTTGGDTRGRLAAGTSVVRWRTRRRLISLQVAVSAGFLFVAAMCVETMVSDWQANTGIDIDRLALAAVDFRLNQQDDTHGRESIDRMLEIARRDPTLNVTAAASGLPFEISTEQVSLSAPDRPFSTSSEGLNSYFISATPEVFRALNLSLIHGRTFDARDVAGGEPVAVISAQNARSLFGTTDVVGRQLLLRNYAGSGQPAAVQTLTVIGTLEDTDVGAIGYRRTGIIYLPLAQHYESRIWLVGRTLGDATAVSGTLRTIIRQADPTLAVNVSGSGSYLLGGRFVFVRIMAGIAAALGGFALFLSMTGLYGVLSHVVARRTREMGVRLALGATAEGLMRMIFVDGGRPVVAGLVLGLICGTIGRGIFRLMVARPISVLDPIALALVPIPLVVAAIVACYLPARRASRVDPNVALRDL